MVFVLEVLLCSSIFCLFWCVLGFWLLWFLGFVSLDFGFGFGGWCFVDVLFVWCFVGFSI